MTDAIEGAWTTGAYEDVAPTYYPLAGRLVERADVGPDDSVLDVGCGTGSVAIAAARRGADVLGVDVTPAMLEHARDNAAVADVAVEWEVGDAGDLPVADDAVDVTLSSLGHMYADPPEAAAAELVRVTRPGGVIGFTAWTPTSVYPFVASVLATYLDPADLPAVSDPPFLWGDSGVVRDRLEDCVSQLACETGTVTQPALSPTHFWRETLRTSGTFRTLVDRVDEADRDALEAEVVETVQPYFDDRTCSVELEYLLATATL